MALQSLRHVDMMYLLFQLHHLLLLKKVTKSILIWISHQSVSVVGAQLRTKYTIMVSKQ